MTFDSSGLLGPQPAHAETLFRSLQVNGFALDLSETGCGKTYTAAAIARNDGRPVVLIAPKAVLSTWTKILHRFNVVPELVINYELLARGNTKWMKFVKQADPERPHVPDATERLPHFRLPKDCLVILDEGHRCKGNGTTNSLMLVSLAVQKIRTLMCSATAACSPMDMKALGFLLQLHNLHDYPDFCRLHGAQWTGRWGSMTFSPDDPAAVKGMNALNNYLFKMRKCASRMVREDFGDLFPESQVCADSYDLGSNEPKIQRVYLDMERELAQLEERCSNYREHIFAVLMKARRNAEILKVPIFCEMVEDLYDEGKSVVLFVNFEDTITAINARLGRLKKFIGKIAYVIGGQSTAERERDIADFQADTKRVCIANVAAGGVAISLHDLNGKFPRASVISPNWSAIQMMQCIGRVWRQGGKTKSVQKIIYAAKCIEETICRRVQDKLTMLNLLHDGDLSEVVRWVE